MNKQKLNEVVNKIMEIDRFADTEELTFPMDIPTHEDQEKWLETFLRYQEDHVRGVLLGEFFTDYSLQVSQNANVQLMRENEYCRQMNEVLKKRIENFEKHADCFIFGESEEGATYIEVLQQENERLKKQIKTRGKACDCGFE